jgi:hypothetical protein
LLQCSSLARPRAKLPTYKWFEATEREEVVTSTKYIDSSTGEAADKDAIQSMALRFTDSPSFSNVLEEVAVPRAVAQELSSAMVPGQEHVAAGGLGSVHPSLTLLQFHPQASLTPLHQVLCCAHGVHA